MSQLIIRPTGAGDETNQFSSPTQANYLNVDEAVADDITTHNYVASFSSWKRDLYAMGDCGLAVGTTINYIRIYMRSFGSTATELAKTAIKSGGTVYEGSNVAGNGGWQNSYTQYTTIGGAAITPAMIDAMQSGDSLFLGDIMSEVRNTQTYILVDYTEGGWANIAKINGITATDLGKINGIAVADIAKINGVAV